jgi:hypothetical protein
MYYIIPLFVGYRVDGLLSLMSDYYEPLYGGGGVFVLDAFL